MTSSLRKLPFLRPLFAGAAVLVVTSALAGCGHQGGAAALGFGGPDGRAPMSEQDRAQHRQRMVERVTKQLQLDTAQQQRFTALLDTLQAQRQAVMPAERTPRSELKGLMTGPSFDRNGAQALLDGRLGAVRQAGPQVIAAFGDFYDSLRPEQQQQVRDFLDRSGGWRGGRGGHRHG